MKTILMPILILSLCSTFLNIYSNINNTLPYLSSSQSSVDYNSIRPAFVNQEFIKKEIDNIFNCNYILNFKNLNNKCDGVSYIMLKLVILDDNLSLEEFTMTLTHELVHLKFFTSNERFTSFKAFQILFESGNEYFKNVALAYANKDFNGLVEYEYSCAGYIEQYLNNNIKLN